MVPSSKLRPKEPKMESSKVQFGVWRSVIVDVPGSKFGKYVPIILSPQKNNYFELLEFLYC